MRNSGTAMHWQCWFLALLLVTVVRAAVIPVSDADVARRATTGATVLAAQQVSAFAPYTQFARAAYCPSSKLRNWNCGEACSATPGFQVTLAEGNGDSVPLYYVGYWPAESSVVVGHEGTDRTKFLSLLTNLLILQKKLDITLFPNVPSSVRVHSGFADSQANTAKVILNETKRLIASYQATTVTVVGHSMGGALAQLDALFMRLNLPSNIHIKAVTYGTPRVGNPAYASYFDSMVSDYVRINNEKDIIPIVPGRGLGFAHPHGEIHIVSPCDVVSCQGDDNASDPSCTILSVPSIFSGNLNDHMGPYEGIPMGISGCY